MHPNPAALTSYRSIPRPSLRCACRGSISGSCPRNISSSRNCTLGAITCGVGQLDQIQTFLSGRETTQVIEEPDVVLISLESGCQQLHGQQVARRCCGDAQVISFENSDAFGIRTWHERLGSIVQPVFVYMETFRDVGDCHPHFNRGHKNRIDINSCPASVVDERLRRSVNHEHIPSTPTAPSSSSRERNAMSRPSRSNSMATRTTARPR